MVKCDMVKKTLIVQPWFCAKGHPAQSLLNTASAIGKDNRVEYLVSINKEWLASGRDELNRLKAWGKVFNFNNTGAKGTSRWNTFNALIKIFLLQIKGGCYRRIFFFDGWLPLLAVVWPMFSLIVGIERLSVLHLTGPERMSQNRLIKWATQKFLLRPDVRL